MGQILAAHLLRGEVADGADDLPIDGCGGVGGVAHRLVDGAHQPEVRELDLVPVADQHVVRLDVAVDHALGMGDR